MNTADLNGAELNEPGDAPPTPAPFVVAGWTCVQLADDGDPFGIDPDQTAPLN